MLKLSWTDITHGGGYSPVLFGPALRKNSVDRVPCSSCFDDSLTRGPPTAASIRRESITDRGLVLMVRQVCKFGGVSESVGMLGDEQIVEHFAIADMEGEIRSVQGLEAALGSLRRAAKAAADEVKQGAGVEAMNSTASQPALEAKHQIQK